jgi:magnesium chelatase family protein
MGLAQAWGAVAVGVSSTLVKVEVDVSRGLPSVGIVGLPQASVTEARWRVRSAIENAGLQWPSTRITIGLSPADVPKSGTSLDLPIAAATLRATNQVPAEAPGPCVLIGELGLDGLVKPVRGALAAGIAARQAGIDQVVAPAANAGELAVIPGLRVVVVRDLAQLARVLRGQEQADTPVLHEVAPLAAASSPDFADIRGHAHARFALEVAAAGGHHCAMVGPPGVGKTLLATRLSSVLPDLPDDRALEVTAIHALAGQLPIGHVLLRRPVTVAPHHSSSAVAILGTMRASAAIPGALTLAHGGVLFMDEAPEFCRPALEGLRQPLECGQVSIMRAGQSCVLPAEFQLVLAANPCPCGLFAGRGDQCTCTSMARRRYAERLSGPLLDRIDVRLRITAPATAELAHGQAESSSEVASRVAEARERAASRFSGLGWSLNARIPTQALRRNWAPEADGVELISDAERSGMSLRGADRVLRVAWSIADLAGSDRPRLEHVSAALALRGPAWGGR